MAFASTCSFYVPELTSLPPFLFVTASLALDVVGHWGHPRPQEMSG